MKGSSPPLTPTSAGPQPSHFQPVGILTEERGLWPLQPKLGAPLWADAGRFLDPLVWTALGFTLSDTALYRCSAALGCWPQPPAAGKNSGYTRTALRAQQCTAGIRAAATELSPCSAQEQIRALGTKDGHGEGGICQCCGPTRSLPLT